MTVLIGLESITKVFPPDVMALSEVSLQIDSGEIHAIVGENGAGKSTLSRIMAGEESPDAGTITWRGSSARFASAREAMAAGIGMVHQELLLIDEIPAWQNVVLGVEPVGRLGRIDVGRARAEVAATFERSGFVLDPDATTGDLSVAARQKLEIAKLLHRHVDLLILDEPTASLAPQEVPVLFDELRRLRDAGRTIVFVSHRLNEVLELADRVSVLRDGKLVATVAAAETDAAGLARLMVEREVVFTAVRTAADVGDEVLRLDAVSGPGLGPVDLVVRAGEIVGVAGVEGNGQRELVGAITGDRRCTDGRVVVSGTDITSADILTRREHLAFVAAERKVDGEAVGASITDNARMTHHRLTPGFSTLGGRVQVASRARRFVDEVRQRFDVAMRSADQPIGSLSGGNQQKVILGRELALERALVVLDQPTRGLDVGSVEQVHRIILGLRAEGRAVLLVSADLDELFQLADRLVVMHRGRVALDGATAGLDAVQVGRAMLAEAP